MTPHVINALHQIHEDDPTLGYRFLTDELEEMQAVEAALNNRPRKTLGWKTPAEALNEHLQLLNQGGVASTG